MGIVPKCLCFGCFEYRVNRISGSLDKRCERRRVKNDSKVLVVCKSWDRVAPAEKGKNMEQLCGERQDFSSGPCCP